MHTIADYQKYIEQEIEGLSLPQVPVSLYEPVSYLMNLGGKRVRPVLTLLSAELFGADMQAVIKPALALEMFHNFTLVHDDLMDHAALRRGKATVHEKWNDSTAILSGDVMLVLAYELLCSVEASHLPEVLTLFNKTAQMVCEGQQLDMDFENLEGVSIDAYIEMIGLKTAALLACCLKMGALLAGASADDLNNIYQFGYQAGIAFQVQDDLLDAYGQTENFGKNIGGDIASNKKTFLAVKARELAMGNTRDELNFLVGQKDMDSASKIFEVLAIYDTLNIKTHAEHTRDAYYSLALSFLEQVALPDDKKQNLKNMADFIINRIN